MQLLVLLVVVATTIVGFLAESGWVPSLAKFLPELLSGVVLLAALALGTRNNFKYVQPRYWLAFAVVVLNMGIGVVVQAVGAGPVFAGIRNYFRAIPMFILPGVRSFSDEQIHTLLKVLLAICLVQLPLAIYQRMQPYVTGDAVSGSLLLSGLLSIFLICAACILSAAYVRRRLSLAAYLVLLLLVMAPTTINETKVTLVLAPLGLAFPFILGSRRGVRARNTVMLVVAIAAFLAVFVPVYNWSQADKPYGKTIGEFFLDERHVGRYMETGKELGTYEGHVGRVDTLRIPLEFVAQNPVTLAFGLGIGNASKSSIGHQFEGRYGPLFHPFMQTSATRLILETGLIGLGLACLLMSMVFRDALVVAQRDSGWLGILALGWSGVVAVLGVAMFYADLIASTHFSYLFWFFSGVISARRLQLAREPVLTRTGAAVS